MRRPDKATRFLRVQVRLDDDLAESRNVGRAARTDADCHGRRLTRKHLGRWWDRRVQRSKCCFRRLPPIIRGPPSDRGGESRASSGGGEAASLPATTSASPGKNACLRWADAGPGTRLTGPDGLDGGRQRLTFGTSAESVPSAAHCSPVGQRRVGTPFGGLPLPHQLLLLPSLSHSLCPFPSIRPFVARYSRCDLRIP